MAIIITQKPNYKTLPVGQDIIFAVTDNAVVANQLRVKFIAEVYISNDTANLTNPESLVATLKTTPNNAGVGMFNLRSILETYVNADQLPRRIPAQTFSTYKNIENTEDKEFPIHLIDKFSTAQNAVRYFKVKFKIEYEVNNVITIAGYSQLTEKFLIFNGYVGHEETLIANSGNYGYNLYTIPERAYIQRNLNSRFLTNAPTTQYAQLTDYGTLAMWNMLTQSADSFETAPNSPLRQIGKIIIKLYNSSDVQLGSDIEVENISGSPADQTGGHNQSGFTTVNGKFLYFGCYPGNLENWNTTWSTHKADVSYYTVQASDALSGDVITQIYTINIISECKYEPIRLTWLNKLGAWDYYTFMKKSVRSLQTKGTTYTQLGGTWNEDKFKIYGYKGGKKSFRVNAKEKITINTDYVSEADAVWFEELMSSPEVYILNGYSEDQYETSTTISGIVNKYVHPVLLTTSSYIRKTIANDKLIQYTFEVDRNKDNRTQTV